MEALVPWLTPALIVALAAWLRSDLRDMRQEIRDLRRDFTSLGERVANLAERVAHLESVRDREETPNSGLVSTARCCGGRGIVRPTGSACARRRQGASLRSAPAFAGLTALTPAPRTPSRLALV